MGTRAYVADGTSGLRVIDAIVGVLAVSNTNYSGPGSLRQQISNSLDGRLVVFDPSLSGQTIPLSSGQLVIAKNLTIDASTLPDGVTVQATPGTRVLYHPAGSALSIKGLTISGGGEPFGGAILNCFGGDLTLRNTSLSGNSADLGGAILNCSSSIATLINTTISNNTRTSYISPLTPCTARPRAR